MFEQVWRWGNLPKVLPIDEIALGDRSNNEPADLVLTSPDGKVGSSAIRDAHSFIELHGCLNTSGETSMIHHQSIDQPFEPLPCSKEVT
jgi:hypothetical protein